jgi:hypothetical protein
MKGLTTLMLAVALIGWCAPSAMAQPIKARAYAPEHLGALSVADQRRVIGLEYTEQSGGGAIPEPQMRFYLDQVRLSNWGFQQIRNDIAQSLGGNGGYAPTSGAETIRCESNDNRPRTCTTPWQNESQLLRQLSKTACIAGQNWTTRRGQVSVSSGCRGEFGPVTGIPTGQLGGEITCESQDRRERSCPTSWPGPSTLSRQLSQTACIAGQNWSSSPGVVRVSGGCRAVFVPTAESLAQDIRCESIQGRYQQCGANLYGNVQLLRQLSDRRCIEGTNWGLRNGAIWVNGGCRAEFRVGGGYGNGYGNGYTGGQNAGYGGGNDYVVTCSSEGGRYTDCAWDHNQGPPRLLQRLSDSQCVQGYSWGYNRRATLWVNHGCRATFGPR